MKHFPDGPDEQSIERIWFSGSSSNLSILNTRSDSFFLSASRSGVYASVRDEEGFLEPFGFGQGINGNLEWVGLGSMIIADFNNDTDGFRGHFFDQSNQYAAIRTTIDEEVYYGWIRMSHSMENEVLTVHDWAWNSEPGGPILAGEIPEPAVYGLILGLGVLGVVAWRRRARRDGKRRGAPQSQRGLRPRRR